MPNPFHYRTHINQLWRTVNGPNPGYIRLRALDALARDLIPGRPRYAIAQQMLNAVDAYEYARHLLRNLYDGPNQPDPGNLEVAAALLKVAPAKAGAPSDASLSLPLPPGEGSVAITEEEPRDEGDDPL